MLRQQDLCQNLLTVLLAGGLLAALQNANADARAAEGPATDPQHRIVEI
jgi:hypothetical protein